MTLAELKHTLDISVRRDDLSAEYTSWINQALRAIQKAHSFVWMESRDELTIVVGQSSVAMPARFKELQKAESPVQLLGDGDRAIPCRIMRQEDLTRLDSAILWPIFFSNVGRRRFFPVFITWVSGDPFLNVFNGPVGTTITEDMDFIVHCYKFLPALAADGDENDLTTEYEELVKAKVKAIAFEEINDPLADAWNKKYEVELRRAIRQDSYKKLAGLNLQMGGT